MTRCAGAMFRERGVVLVTHAVCAVRVMFHDTGQFDIVKEKLVC